MEFIYVLKFRRETANRNHQTMERVSFNTSLIFVNYHTVEPHGTACIRGINFRIATLFWGKTVVSKDEIVSGNKHIWVESSLFVI